MIISDLPSGFQIIQPTCPQVIKHGYQLLTSKPGIERKRVLFEVIRDLRDLVFCFFALIAQMKYANAFTEISFSSHFLTGTGLCLIAPSSGILYLSSLMSGISMNWAYQAALRMALVKASHFVILATTFQAFNYKGAELSRKGLLSSPFDQCLKIAIFRA